MDACHDPAGGQGMNVSSGYLKVVEPVGPMQKSGRQSTGDAPAATTIVLEWPLG